MIAIDASPYWDSARELFNGKSLRSLNNDKCQIRKLLSTAKHEAEVLPSGLIIPNRIRLLADGTRMDQVFTKIVLGLFYDKFDCPMPESHGVYLLDRDNREAVWAMHQLCEQMSPIQSFGDEVFEWRFLADEDDPHTHFWAYRFYRRPWFFAITQPVQPEDLSTA